MNDDKLLTIIIPIFNEEKTLLKVLENVEKFKKNLPAIEVIAVNDGSTDNSLKILNENRHLYDSLINNSFNKGKGSAARDALEVAKGKYITFQDADLEYDPKDLNKFLKVIEKFEPDLIIGSRFKYSDYTRSHLFINRIGNFLITLLFNIFYQTTFTDIYSCYICFKNKLLNHEQLKTNGFEQQAEILCKIVKNGKIFFEVPINYNGRSHEEGKKIKFYHIFYVIYQIIIGKFK